MKVLQIVPELNAGGVERTVIEVADALTRAGHAAHVASAGGRLEGELSAAGGQLHRLPMQTKNPLRWAANTKALRAIISDHEIDIVHARSRAPAFAARSATRAENVAWITTYHGIYNAPSGPLGAPKRRYNAVMASGDRVIANSAFTKAHIINTHGTDPDRIEVVYRGVDMARFDPARVTHNMRADWGVPESVPLWLLPGRLTEWKGQRVAIAALTHAPEARLVLLGDAQGRTHYVETLRRLAHSLGVGSRLLILPHSSDMPTALAAADVVISASTDPEAFGRIAVEAQAMGKPVVATAHGGALETVEDGITGRLVPPGDPKALATAAREVLGWNHDPGYARARIDRLFSDQALKSRVLTIYDRLLREQTPL